jgi:hypothetical protein
MSVLSLGFLLPCLTIAAPSVHEKTEWQLEPSVVFDAICLLNTLTGDSFYLDYYKADYEVFAPKMTPEVRQALRDLKRKVKDEAGGIISASLCLYYSAVNDTSLDQLIATTQNPADLQAAFKKTVYYDEGNWKLYDSVRPELITIFSWLKTIQFEQTWRQETLPKITKTIRKIEKDLPKYNVIREDETVLGYALPSDRITIYVLYYSQPHGIKIVGNRFLTDIAWPFEIVVRNAAHEMMHPPFDLAADSELVAILSTLTSDTFLMNKILHHNTSFGYNSFNGFIEEDCVQALDQRSGERLHIAIDARLRWTESDDGMHVFAVALYSAMQSENYNEKKERFRDFLVRMIRSGKLAPGKIEALHKQFYSMVKH